jgi:hypothetical protein
MNNNLSRLVLRPPLIPMKARVVKLFPLAKIRARESAEYARKIGRSRSTLFLWIKQGCNLRDPKSVAEWVTRNTIRETNISKRIMPKARSQPNEL